MVPPDARATMPGAGGQDLRAAKPTVVLDNPSYREAITGLANGATLRYRFGQASDAIRFMIGAVRPGIRIAVADGFNARFDGTSIEASGIVTGTDEGKPGTLTVNIKHLRLGTGIDRTAGPGAQGIERLTLTPEGSNYTISDSFVGVGTAVTASRVARAFTDPLGALEAAYELNEEVAAANRTIKANGAIMDGEAIVTVKSFPKESSATN